MIQFDEGFVPPLTPVPPSRAHDRPPQLLLDADEFAVCAASN
jgi:hypothetical protein